MGIARRGTAACVAVVVALGLGLTGCDWPQHLAGPQHTGSDRFERGIERANALATSSWRGRRRR